MSNVVDSIVAQRWCIGCGLCAAACPGKRLQIALNERGEYSPREKEPCNSRNCRFCKQVCPASDENGNESEIGQNLFAGIPNVRQHPDCGYYLNAFVGHCDEREACASGGLVSWTLTALLEQKSVDAVLTVGPANSDPGQHPFFSFKVCRNREEIQSCSRSCYYPVQVGDVVRYALENDGNYAIVALPCTAKGIRLAQNRFPKLKERIKFVLGLVCGQGKSVHFAEYVAALAGADPWKIESLKFRVKTPDRPATNYGLSVKTPGKDEMDTLFWSEGMSVPWLQRYFTPFGCSFCDDVFAECADAAFMDAWLPEYQQDWRGTSIVISRNPLLSELMQESRNANIEQIPIEKAIQSQKGVVDQKRRQTSVRLALARKKGRAIPKKRVSPDLKAASFFDRKNIELKMLFSDVSGDIWVKSQKNKIVFQKEIEKLTRGFQRGFFILKFLERVHAKIKRILKR